MGLSLSWVPVIVRAVLHKEFVGPKPDKLLESQAWLEKCMTRVRDLLLHPQDRVRDLLGLDQGGDRGLTVGLAHLHGLKTRVNA